MKILDSLVEMVRVVHGLARKVAQQDRDLAQQMRRASTSAGLNASEGVWAKAGKRRSRLEDAVNSARETLMALRLAEACGYLQSPEVAVAQRDVESVIRVLVGARLPPVNARPRLPGRGREGASVEAGTR